MKALLFDVEGTLVDSVDLQIRCWQRTLARHAFDLPRAVIHSYSGMDGKEMLQKLVPGLSAEHRAAIVAEQGKRFEEDFLAAVQPIAGVRSAFLSLRRSGFALGFATDCNKRVLRRYRALLGVDDLVDVVACGEDVTEGKPAPALVAHGIAKLGLAASEVAMVGDTPFDALAAVSAGARAIGVLTGGFSAASLREAGASVVFAMIVDIATGIQGGSDAAE